MRHYLLVWGGLGLLAASAGAEDKLEFNRDIRPILMEKCIACHGPDVKARKADLRLDLRDAAIDAAALTPGEPDASELVRRILATDDKEIMPPPASKKPLTDAEKQLLVRWVKEGAEYQRHWSFIAPQSPAPPEVQLKSWPLNPIDFFTLARMEQAGLKPAPEADRATLIRRVAYDLTGLPPTLAELARFAGIDSANWYEQMVDYYFGKPAYGERMALAWLDAARYGDSSVFHADGPRDMWPWRDWVISAYNSNLPFDRFVIDQLAGDLLPEATPYQKIASGFNRNHASTDEGGAIDEEWRVFYVVDRVKTTSNVFLGLSMECGQCHDHKYDPISQQEYYGFYAYFNQTTDPGMQTRNGNQAPVVDVPNPERDLKVAALKQRIDEAENRLKEHQTKVEPQFLAWADEAAAKAKAGEKQQPPADMLAYFPLDEGQGAEIIDSLNSARKGKVEGKSLWEQGQSGGAFRIDGSNFIDLGNVGDYDEKEAFSYGCWVKPQGNPMGVPLGKMDEGNSHRGWDFYIVNGQVAVHIIHSWPDKAIKVTTKEKIPADQWSHLFATYDGSGKAAGLKIYFNGKEQPWNVNADSLLGSTKTTVPLKIGRRHNSSGFNGLVDEVRLFMRALSPEEVSAVAGGDPITPILTLDADKRTPEQTQTLRTHYLHQIDADYKTFAEQKRQMQAEISALLKDNVTSMVMGEQPTPRATYLLMRGNYNTPDTAQAIKPAVPAFLPPLPENAPPNRLGLAQWLVSPDHPLTARVAVNQFWTKLFGQGIVSTPMDFGSQGAWPTHPELLDWLAVDFRTNGWDVKRSLKQMLMSATYRQDSRITPELAAKDPLNKLLARGSRFRLQGEIIRDAALAVSGLLVDHVGGPGVKPYQPAGLWAEVSLDGNLQFIQDQGDKLYRKSMYIYWKRSAPHPGMQIFDAPTRETCVVQRPTTNTPLQALYTLNDIQFVEAARRLAGRMMQEGGASPAERIGYAWRLLTSQQPSGKATAALLSLYETELAKYQASEAAAKELLGIGESPRAESLPLAEHAAWTVVANVLLNMDSALTRF